MKKILSVLLALLLLVSAVPVGAMAAENPTITAVYTAGEETLKKGDSVEVAFRIDNNPGINGATFELKYDAKVLEFSGLKTQLDEYDEEEIVGLFKKGLCTWYTKTNRITWAADSTIAKDNILFWAVFDVVGCGDVTVTADVLELVDSTVNPNVQYGSTVTVKESESISVPSAPATSVTLDATSASMYPGDTKNLKTTVTPENSTDEIVWTSSNEKVAIVRNGKVTALQAGTTTITAKANDTVSATCEVTVKNHVHMQQKSGEGEYAEVVGYSSGATQFNYWYNGEKYTMTPDDVYVFDVTEADTVKFGFDDSNFNRTGVAVCKGLDGMREDNLYFNGDAVRNGKEFAVADIVKYALVSYEDVVKAFGDSLPKLNISESDTLAFMCYQDQSGYVMSSNFAP